MTAAEQAGADYFTGKSTYDQFTAQIAALFEADKALEDLQSSAAQAPQAKTYFHLAQAYLAAQRRDDAVQALQKAQNLGLKVEGLHPLEKDSYQQLVGELR